MEILIFPQSHHRLHLLWEVPNFFRYHCFVFFFSLFNVFVFALFLFAVWFLFDVMFLLFLCRNLAYFCCNVQWFCIFLNRLVIGFKSEKTTMGRACLCSVIVKSKIILMKIGDLRCLWAGWVLGYLLLKQREMFIKVVRGRNVNNV